MTFFTRGDYNTIIGIFKDVAKNGGPEELGLNEIQFHPLNQKENVEAPRHTGPLARAFRARFPMMAEWIIPEPSGHIVQATYRCLEEMVHLELLSSRRVPTGAIVHDLPLNKSLYRLTGKSLPPETAGQQATTPLTPAGA